MRISLTIKRVLSLGAGFAVATFGLVGLSSTPAVAGDIAPTSSPGYWIMTGYGTNTGFGSAPTYTPYGDYQACVDSPNTVIGPPGGGSFNGTNAGCVGLSGDRGGQGYWYAGSLGSGGLSAVIAANGTVTIPNGGCDGLLVSPLAYPVVGVSGVGTSSSATGTGAWMVASDGGVFAMCGAPYLGSMGGQPLNKPIVGIAATPDGKGYWEVASDGGVFAFGDASFYGSMGGQPLNKPIVGIAATPDGKGYWEVASDGGIFAFGDAVFSGSMGGQHLNSPMVAMAANATGAGYWTVAADGGVFSFGGAPFLGSLGGQPLDAPVVGMAVKY